MLIAATTLVTLFLNSDYRPGLLGAAVWFVLGILWFAAIGRKRLILAPEEEFAQNKVTEETVRKAARALA